MFACKFPTKHAESRWPVAIFLMALALPILLTGRLHAEDELASEEPAADEKPAASSANQYQPSDRRAEMRKKKMMERFDANEDGQLSEDERAEMREFMQKRREKQGRKGADRKDSGKKDARNKKGPRDKSFRDGFRDKRGPDRFGPPEGTGKAGKGHRGRRGPDDRIGPPNMNKLFEQFDKDSDDKLDRKEFGNALRTMHEMRMQMEGRHGKGHDGFRPRSPRDERGRSDHEFRPGPPHERGFGPPGSPDRGPRLRGNRDGDKRRFRGPPREDSEKDLPSKRRPRRDRDLDSAPLFPSEESEQSEEAEDTSA